LRRKVLTKELELLQEIDIISDGKQFTVTQNSQVNEDSFKEVRDRLEGQGQSAQSELITKQLAEIDAQLAQIASERKELNVLQQNITALEPDMMIVSGTQKKVVMNMLHYYEFQERHLAGLYLNPETKKAIEIVHYHVQNNLPVKRELLWEVLPELFEQEINELEEYKRNLLLSKRPHFESDHQTIL
jgi:hypothetical protein